ncbi:ribosome production factor 2 [Nematocida sp. LUAm3]|nr:ribosome production factor 2 [Nematocida sp. LUAm3]KAI5173914.1 ribosome production factor 2 [Nematocida sp. LUAm2]KAI5177341.1 ribosome production factor 2 [Nematocida sp. LUAm1]
MKEPHKKLLILTQAQNSPKTRPLVDFFLAAKKDAIRYIDEKKECLPTVENISTSNGKLEEQMKRVKASLFLYITQGKNEKLLILLGRTHEYQIIDIVKYEVTWKEELTNLSLPTEALRLILLSGRSSCDRTQNLILDVLRDALPNALSLSLCKYAYGISFTEQSFALDAYKLTHSPFSFSKSLINIAFTFLGNYRCEQLTYHTSKKTIRQTEKKIKNVEKGPLSSIIGTIHMEKQDLSEIKLSKGKAFSK